MITTDLKTKALEQTTQQEIPEMHEHKSHSRPAEMDHTLQVATVSGKTKLKHILTLCVKPY